MDTPTEPNDFIYGIHPILEALKQGKELDKILIQKGLSNVVFREVQQLLQETQTPYQIVPLAKLNRITKKNHQGLIAFTAEISYHSAENLLPTVFEKGLNPLILVLDRVTDVRNFGAIARTAECCGVNFMVIPSRGNARITADAIKTSSGALHRIPVCREDNLKKTLQYLKHSGLKLVACHEKSDRSIFAEDLKVPTAILMGSEEDGISSEYLKLCDSNMAIPLMGAMQSLNVSVAAGIALFETVRQRNS